MVSTDTKHILLVNITTYFNVFPNHYSKSFRQKPSKQSPHYNFSSQSPLQDEEELEQLRYSGITQYHRSMGVAYLGSYNGQYALKKRYKELSKRLESFDMSKERGMRLDDTLKLHAEVDKPVKPLTERKWYTRPGLLSCDTERSRHVVPCMTNLFKSREKSTSHAPVPFHLSTSYPIHCLLPPADDHVTSGSALFHLSYNNGIVMAYFTPKKDSSDIGMSPTVQDSVPSTNCIAIYRVAQQNRSIAR